MSDGIVNKIVIETDPKPTGFDKIAWAINVDAPVKATYPLKFLMDGLMYPHLQWLIHILKSLPILVRTISL